MNINKNRMTVQELINQLLLFNPAAEVRVIVDNYPVDFELCYGGQDGGTAITATEVVFMVGGDNEGASMTTRGER